MPIGSSAAVRISSSLAVVGRSENFCLARLVIAPLAAIVANPGLLNRPIVEVGDPAGGRERIDHGLIAQLSLAAHDHTVERSFQRLGPVRQT